MKARKTLDQVKAFIANRLDSIPYGFPRYLFNKRVRACMVQLCEWSVNDSISFSTYCDGVSFLIDRANEMEDESENG